MNLKREDLFLTGMKVIVAVFVTCIAIYFLALLFPLPPFNFSHLKSGSSAQKAKEPSSTTALSVRLRYIIWGLNSAGDVRNSSVPRGNLSAASTNRTTARNRSYSVILTRMIYYFQVPSKKKYVTVPKTTTASSVSLQKRTEVHIPKDISKKDKTVLGVVLGVLLSALVIIYAAAVTCLDSNNYFSHHSIRETFDKMLPKRFKKLETNADPHITQA